MRLALLPPLLLCALVFEPSSPPLRAHPHEHTDMGCQLRFQVSPFAIECLQNDCPILCPLRVFQDETLGLTSYRCKQMCPDMTNDCKATVTVNTGSITLTCVVVDCPQPPCDPTLGPGDWWYCECF